MSAVELRPLEKGDMDRVAALFWDTFVLGDPVPFPIGFREEYEELVLGWYRANPGPSALAWSDGRPVGYVLACLDQPSFERWQVRRGWAYASTVIRSRLGGRMTPQERRFFRLRLVDGFEAWRDEDPAATGAHAHFNVARGARSGLLVRELVEHIDGACAGAGLTHWTGQINAREGTREEVLQRYGFVIHSRAPNRTLSWLAGEPVRRLTVVRRVGDLRRMPAAS